MEYHTLYSYRRCPYAMRARMALFACGIQCQVHEIDFKDKPAAMLAASPKGTVPVLVLKDSTIIDESIDIVYWALRQNDPIEWMKGEGYQNLIAENDGMFKMALDQYKYPNRFPDEDCTNAREEGLAFLEKLNDKLTKQAFLLRNKKTIADICIFPFIRQFANVDRAWFDALDLKPLQNWLHANLESDLFQHVMEKHKETPYPLI